MLTTRKRKTLFTAEELERLPDNDRRFELVDGKLYEMPPAGARHGDIAMEIGALLRAHVRANRLGRVFAAETGFVLRHDPDTVRTPDAAFVAEERIPAEGPPDSYFDLAPDLAVEVVSPGDRARQIRDKVQDWLRSGTRLVWVIYPSRRTVIVHRARQEQVTLSEGDTLDGGEVVPGFECRVNELFA